MTFSLDGADLGSVDAYGDLALNETATIDAIHVGSSGTHALKVRLDAKNPASSLATSASSRGSASSGADATQWGWAASGRRPCSAGQASTTYVAARQRRTGVVHELAWTSNRPLVRAGAACGQAAPAHGRRAPSAGCRFSGSVSVRLNVSVTTERLVSGSELDDPTATLMGGPRSREVALSGFMTRPIPLRRRRLRGAAHRRESGKPNHRVDDICQWPEDARARGRRERGPSATLHRPERRLPRRGRRAKASLFFGRLLDRSGGSLRRRSSKTRSLVHGAELDGRDDDVGRIDMAVVVVARLRPAVQRHVLAAACVATARTHRHCA